MTDLDGYDGPPCALDGCRHLPDPGIALCSGHARRLGDQLAALATLWAQLDATPSMQAPEPGTGGGHPLASQRAVGSMDVMAMRAPLSRPGDGEDPDGNHTPPVLATILSYAAMVRAERRIPLGKTPRTLRLYTRGPGPVCAHWCTHDTCMDLTFRGWTVVLPTFTTERRLLADQLPWILEQDWAGEFADEIRQAVNGMEAATGHGAPRIPRPRRACTCGGRITVVDGAAQCDGDCRGVWSGLAMAQIGGTAA